MSLQIVNPESLGAPRGYANGVVAPAGGRLLFVAGQIAWDKDHKLVGKTFADQFAQALANVVTVVRAAGGSPQRLTRLTVYVTDRQAYLDSRGLIGETWRKLMAGHYPAMSLVEVKALLEPGALVEIEATAVLPP